MLLPLIGLQRFGRSVPGGMEVDGARVPGHGCALSLPLLKASPALARWCCR